MAVNRVWIASNPLGDSAGRLVQNVEFFQNPPVITLLKTEVDERLCSPVMALKRSLNCLCSLALVLSFSSSNMLAFAFFAKRGDGRGSLGALRYHHSQIFHKKILPLRQG